jgi:dTDP-4-amino-4,6-dideoxygalactose transaminase
MDKPKHIYLSPPHLNAAAQARAAAILETPWIAPFGPEVTGFESDLCTFTGAPHAAALSSGTAALHLGLILLGVKPGDYVICQSMTFSASANPIAYLGATPLFVDSEPNSWNMDPQLLDEAISQFNIQHSTFNIPGSARIAAIIPVHLYGMPANMDAINAVAQQYGIPVLEDAAEALGSTYGGRACGTLGQLGVLSFNGNKIITTSGGGALLGQDAALVEQARFLSTQARDAAPHYQHSQIGYNYRMSNVLAGIGRGQMEVLPERVAARRRNYERYRNFFAAWNARGFDIQFQEEQEGSFSNRWLTCIVVDPATNKGLTREALRLALEAENIEARPLWKPMHLQPVFAHAPRVVNGTSERLFDHGLCLPSGSNLSAADFDRIVQVLNRLLEAH